MSLSHLENSLMAYASIILIFTELLKKISSIQKIYPDESNFIMISMTFRDKNKIVKKIILITTKMVLRHTKLILVTMIIFHYSFCELI